MSDDGKWMWDGNEWIPAPPANEPKIIPTTNSIVNSSVVEKNIFQKPMIYIVAFIFLPFLGSNCKFKKQRLIYNKQGIMTILMMIIAMLHFHWIKKFVKTI